MALLVDGVPNTIESLRAQDSGVADVAHGEGIDLTAKLEIARREIEIEIESLLRKTECGRLDQVVATAALKRWHLLLTLAMTYRDAYFSQLNDRYEKRWRAYEEESRGAAERVLGGGIGLARNPLPRPGAVTAEVGPGQLAEATYWVRATWVSADGAESAPSEVVLAAAVEPNSLAVSCGEAPGAAAGWNVYVGTSAESVGRQNASPLAVGAAWVLDSGSVLVGAEAGEGQTPDFYCSRQRLLRRS